MRPGSIHVLDESSERKKSYNCYMQTTDKQSEVYDVIDSQDRVIGQATRREVHANPSLVHRSITILLVRGRDIFLQKRSLTKDSFPGIWTCSVAGHVDSGETYEQAAFRELKEELGITAVGPLRIIDEQVISYEHETERTRFFRYDDATQLPIVLDPRETSEGQFFPLTHELLKEIGTTMPATPCLHHLATTFLQTQIR